MLAYQALDVTGQAAVRTVGASAANQVVSLPSFSVSFRGSLNCAVKITVGTVTAATGITAKLQTTTDPAGTWVDSKTVSISGNGDFYIKLNVQVSGDQTYLPLLPQARIVISSGAGDAATVSKVQFVQAV